MSPYASLPKDHKSDNVNEFVTLLMGQHKYDITFNNNRPTLAKSPLDDPTATVSCGAGGLGLGLGWGLGLKTRVGTLVGLGWGCRSSNPYADQGHTQLLSMRV